MNSFSSFQDKRVRRGAGLDHAAETEEAPPTLEADPDRESEESRDLDVHVAAAMRGGGGGEVAQDHKTGRDDGQEAGRQKEEAEQGNNVGLAAIAVATAEQEEERGRGKDIAQDHPAMTVVNQAGEESEQWIYHVAGNFGEVFNLAIWRILQRSPN